MELFDHCNFLSVYIENDIYEKKIKKFTKSIEFIEKIL